jgi:carboxyl-terminal processing protease
LSRPQRSGFGSGVVTGLVIGLIVAAVVGVVGGVLTDDGGDDAITEARETIDANYFHSVDEQTLQDASINGMVGELRRRYEDRFSHYFNAEQLQEFESATSGSFKGVGLGVNEVERGLSVGAVYPGSPAERAGIEEGDVITAVDGKSIAGLPAEVSTARIKGPVGTEVELRVVPASDGSAEEVTVRRATVRIPAVVGRIRRAAGRKVAYVRFATFSEGAHGELRDTIERLYRRGAEGLVLDMRGNGGGLLNEAVLSASIFVEDGKVVSTRSRTQGNRDYEAVGDAIERRPTVVLVDRDTASAAEILTAALEEYDLGTVVGTRTYGKGTFQEVIRLGAGGALDLTVGQYLTADGTSILGEGVKPQVRVDDDPGTDGDDEALDRALRVLGQKL